MTISFFLSFFPNISRIDREANAVDVDPVQWLAKPVLNRYLQPAPQRAGDRLRLFERGEMAGPLDHPELGARD